MGFSIGKIFKAAAPVIAPLTFGALNFASAASNADALRSLSAQLGPSPQERELLSLLVEAATRAEEQEKRFQPQIEEALRGQLELGITGQDIAQRALTGQDITEIPGVELALNQFEERAIQQFGPGFLQSEAGIRAREAFKERVARVALGFGGTNVPLPTSERTITALQSALGQAGQLQGRTALAESVRTQASRLEDPINIFQQTLGQTAGFARAAAPFLAGGGSGGSAAFF